MDKIVISGIVMVEAKRKEHGGCDEDVNIGGIMDIAQLAGGGA